MNAPVSVEPDPAARSRARNTGRETAAMLIPLDADGRPRASDRTTGQLLLLTANQVTIAFDAPHPPCHGDALAIGVSEQPGCPAYASVVIQQVDQQVAGKSARRWQVHGRFGGPLQSLLEVGRFAPAFHTETLQYVVE
jgi:hypothetical protein